MTEVSSSPRPTHRDGPMLFVESLDAPEIDRDDYHHISKVLRVSEGAPIVLCDGAGAWARSSLSRSPIVDGERYTVEPRRPHITVGFVVVKGDWPELVVQKLTELGVDDIAPLTSDHGVVKWNAERRAKQHQRFERIAREASMQCRRTTLPVVHEVQAADEFVMGHPGSLVCDAGAPPLGVVLDAQPDRPVALVVGPEGGWSAREQGLFTTRVAIADNILRAETAVITAAALVTAVRSNLVTLG